MIEFNVFATFYLRFLYVFISEVGITAAIHLEKYTAAQAKGDTNKNTPPQGAEVLVVFPAFVLRDDELRRSTASNNL